VPSTTLNDARNASIKTFSPSSSSRRCLDPAAKTRRTCPSKAATSRSRRLARSTATLRTCPSKVLPRGSTPHGTRGTKHVHQAVIVLPASTHNNAPMRSLGHQALTSSGAPTQYPIQRRHNQRAAARAVSGTALDFPAHRESVNGAHGMSHALHFATAAPKVSVFKAGLLLFRTIFRGREYSSDMTKRLQIEHFFRKSSERGISTRPN